MSLAGMLYAEFIWHLLRHNSCQLCHKHGNVRALHCAVGATSLLPTTWHLLHYKLDESLSIYSLFTQGRLESGINTENSTPPPPIRLGKTLYRFGVFLILAKNSHRTSLPYSECIGSKILCSFKSHVAEYFRFPLICCLLALILSISLCSWISQQNSASWGRLC